MWKTEQMQCCHKEQVLTQTTDKILDINICAYKPCQLSWADLFNISLVLMHFLL